MGKFLIFLTLFAVAGCGYTTRGCFYDDERIVIKPVVNKISITSEDRKYSKYTSFPILIENKLTNELVSKFNIDGYLKVVSKGPEAMELSCDVYDYDKEALRYDDDDDVEEQRLRLYVRMKLVSSEGKTLKAKTVVGESSYYLSGPNQESESSAQVDLIDDTARRILEAVVEEW